jgi:hypothetical protein
MIDESTIVDAVRSLSLVGNEEGLIPAFGLYLTSHYASYYNRISFAYLRDAEKRGAANVATARERLVEAGHVCAFNTFGGIMLSQEWDAVVAPMLESREDWIRGTVGVVNALGWGRWSLERLVAGEELIVSVANSYESDGWLAEHPVRPKEAGGVCCLVTGGVAGLMNLLYHGDITKRPSLDPSYYAKLFTTPGRFVASELECRATGAPACRVVARRS